MSDEVTVGLYEVPEWAGDGRICINVAPDTTGKTAIFMDVDGERVALDIMGWATVVTLEKNQLPRFSFEPVVDEPDFGPISLGDLYAEGAGLELLEVE